MNRIYPIVAGLLALASAAAIPAADNLPLAAAPNAASFAARLLHTQCVLKHADPAQVELVNEFGLSRLPVAKALHYLHWQAGSAWITSQVFGDVVLTISGRLCSVMTHRVDIVAAQKQFLEVLQSVAGKSGQVKEVNREEKRVSYGMVYRYSYKVTTGLPDVSYNAELTLSDSKNAPLQSTIAIMENI